MPVFGTRVEGCPYVIRPSAYALARNSDGLLAVVQTSKGCFLPGGGLEHDESPQDTVAREAREEAGLVLAPRDAIAKAVEIAYSSEEHTCFEKRSVFLIADVEGEAIPVEPDHELLWLSPTEAVAVLSPESHRWAVQRVMRD